MGTAGPSDKMAGAGNRSPRDREGMAATVGGSCTASESLLGKNSSDTIMRALRQIFVVMLIAMTPVAGRSGPAMAAETLEGPVRARVIEVVDGDSLRVVVHVWLGQHIETLVRIRGIDTPERQGTCPGEKAAAAAATAALSRMIGSGPVVLSRIAGDKYFGRVLADVASGDGVPLGPAMLQSGLARPYDGGARRPWCDREKAKPEETVVGNVR